MRMRSETITTIKHTPRIIIMSIKGTDMMTRIRTAMMIKITISTMTVAIMVITMGTKTTISSTMGEITTGDYMVATMVVVLTAISTTKAMVSMSTTTGYDPQGSPSQTIGFFLATYICKYSHLYGHGKDQQQHFKYYARNS